MLTIVINAGGESRRMGENKALKLFHGQPLISRMAARLTPLAEEILITTRTPQDFAYLALPTVFDLKPGFGALSGLYTALTASHQPLVAVLACDMPFINPDLLAVERDLMLVENVDVVIPFTPKGAEPLHAVYRREVCLPAIETAMAAGQRRLISWFSAVRVREMPAGEVSQIDPLFRSFINLNTPDEFHQAELLDDLS